MRQGFVFSITVSIILCASAVAAPPTYTISGVVATAEGVGVEGVNIVLDGDVGPTVTAADGSYSIIVPKRWTGTVTVSKVGWLITPASRNYPPVDTDYTGQNYTAFQPKISGIVTKSDGTPLAGVTVMADSGGDSDTTDASGYYELYVPYNWSGTVSATLADYGFTDRIYTNVVTNKINQNFSGFQPMISGYVKEANGTPLYGVTFTADDGGGTSTTNGSGYYQITVPYNWSGTITILTSGLGWTLTPDFLEYSSVISNINQQNYTAENIGISVALDGSGDFTTIQAAVDASFYDGNSDLIIVSDGIYTGNGNIGINITNKDITVKSEGDPNSCIIDCQGLDNAFDLLGGDVFINGFTVQNGVGNEGGAIQCNFANFIIQNCKFLNNTATRGGAVNKNSGNGSIIIRNCEFINNECGSGGGAISLYSDEQMIENCSFIGNRAGQTGGAVAAGGRIIGCSFHENTAGPSGGAIYTGGDTLIKNCEFYFNRTTRDGPVIGPYGGGGINIMHPRGFIVENCIFENNDADNGTAGSGILVMGRKDFPEDEGILVENCIFRNNENTGIYIETTENVTINNSIVETSVGRGIFCNASTVEISNSLISHNSTAGVSLYYSPCIIDGCTIANNGGTYGAVAWNDNASLDIINTIVWGNTDPQLSENSLAPGSQIAFCDIQGGYTGTGNIDADPLFADASVGDYHLQPGSPCIDTADNTAVTDPNDLDGLLRIVDGNCDGTPTVDMGAYEFNPLYIGDFEGNDCDVDLGDFAVMAQSWQQDDPAIDIAPYLAPDGVIDLGELLVIVENWMLGTE